MGRVKPLYKIGQLVEVNLNHQVVTYYDENSYRRVVRSIDINGKRHTNELWVARITGAKLFQEGKYYAGYKPESNPTFLLPTDSEDYSDPYLHPITNVEVWGVRLGYRNKEIHFFPADITVLAEHLHRGDIPFFWTGWNDRARKQMSDESKDWPRDKKGRWR